jgi:hypothetical protein
MMTGTPADDMLPRFDVSSPSIARVYDYVLGGKDNISQVVPVTPVSASLVSV